MGSGPFGEKLYATLQGLERFALDHEVRSA
jgi:hypothetical protein